MNRKSKTLRDLVGQIVEYKETLYKQVPANNRANCKSFYNEKCGEVIHKGVVSKYWVNSASLSHFITLNINGENKRFKVSPIQRYINKDGVWVEYEESNNGRFLVTYYFYKEGTTSDYKTTWVEVQDRREIWTKMSEMFPNCTIYSITHEEDIL